ncbi:MAG: CPBP family intramembrane metalloprotease [Oscillospiraceae bacterium]|jgi:membrane protease YdiL (CAAX protease family)|nr:CPBP family intramembrane metalloprotease [Oscillospiraceae bacterium]
MEKIKNFKTVCFKIGVIMTVFFSFRMLGGLVISFLHADFSDELSETARFIAVLLINVAANYIIPIMTAVVLLGVKSPRELYRKPPRLAKALGNFPAMYGLGQLARLLTLLVFWLIMKFVNFNRSFNPVDTGVPQNVACGVAMAVYAVVCAAFFEEFITRGIFLEALRPYGTGFAITASAFLFGIMHGNFEQFFYAFVLGIVLGYIAVQTGSILASTVLHAMFNSLAAFAILFMSTESSNYINYKGKIPDENMIVLAFYGMFSVMFAGLLICGIILAFKKLSRWRVYKVPNGWTEITAGKKTAVFITRFSVIIMFALAADAFAGEIIANKIFDAIRGDGF